MKNNKQISNSFVTTLTEIRAGRCMDELSDRLAELVGQVKETAKAGTLTLKIKVAPASAGDVTQIFITDTVTIAAPQMVRPSTLFYPTEDNALLRRDPNQREMDLRPVPSIDKPADLREVASAS